MEASNMLIQQIVCDCLTKKKGQHTKCQQAVKESGGGGMFAVIILLM